MNIRVENIHDCLVGCLFPQTIRHKILIFRPIYKISFLHIEKPFRNRQKQTNEENGRKCRHMLKIIQI